MSSYKYIVKDYHAVKEAEIILDGITVLSGINGCGKSTLSRWLYYIISGSANYDKNLFKEYADNLSRYLLKIYIGLRDTGRINLFDAHHISPKDKIFAIEQRLSEINYNSEKDIEKATVIFTNAIEYIGLHLNRLMSLLSIAERERILTYLDIDCTGHTEDYSELFLEKYKGISERLHKDLIEKIIKRPADSFFKYIHQTFRFENDEPKTIRFEEDDVDIIDDRQILNILNLNDVIYIDTPISVTAGDSKNPFWSRLHEMMLDDKKEMSVEEKKILLRIKSLLGGETILQEDDVLGDKTLRFISSDKTINIELNNAATGYKTLAYLQRLIENGYINENTLLMIDEPEAHLHPQWIVEFARLLVLLNKKLGLKIMLASHNPDMVAAIQAISAREGISEHTNFYVAKQDIETPHQYVYKHLGNDISEIFESFNIAINRIRCYGDVCD